MNKLILITFLFVVGISHTVSAQINLDFSAGINHSTCEFKDFQGVQPNAKQGFFVGVSPNYQFNKKVKFLVDVQYSVKGYKTDSEADLLVSDFKFSYLDIIPEIEYNVLNRLAVGVGINYGVKLTEKFKIGDEDWSEAEDLEIIKSTDFGLTGKLKFTHKNMFGFVRYNLGLQNILELAFTDVNGEDIDGIKQLNRNLQVGVGYSLN